MITRIGVIYEDATSLGFLLGLRDRLKCEAELIPPTPAIGKTPHLTRRTAKRAWRYFQKEGVQLVVRFTDADVKRWQDVRRTEKKVFPEEGASQFVCGVAVSAVEDWLSLDPHYIASLLGLDSGQLQDPVSRIGGMKRALIRAKRAEENTSEFVAGVVRDAPREVFQRWLKDKALRRFYQDCQAAARAAECETLNELGTAK